MIGGIPTRGLLQNCFKVFIVSEFILNWRRTEGLIRRVEEETYFLGKHGIFFAD
jgi:hypothetical protein